MNRIYKHIWNDSLGCLVVVSELTKGARGKKCERRTLAAALVASATLAAPVYAGDVLPTGGQIIAGSGTIAASDGAMTIHQSTDRLIANWQSFSIGEHHSVTFNQPGTSSVALNRVVGQDPSQILGSLNANGQVFLVNPNGVVFGQGAQVQTGAFAASTLGISDADFLAGRYDFAGAGGAILNQGSLAGTVVALIAPTVVNEGTISGDAALAAGTDVALDFDGDGLLSVQVHASTLATLVDNRGLIQTDGGVAILTAKGASAALASVVNNSGIVAANSLTRQGGRILLDAHDGSTTVSGTLDASSAGERGGHIVVTGERVLLDDTARLDARGASRGGEIYAGGGWQGSDPAIRQAVTTVVAPGAMLDASATDRGDGGTVVAWSDIHNPDSVTRASGTFYARGGADGGNGGRIETSGHVLQTAGVRGGASAPAGEAGQWLFDPYNVTITSDSQSGGSFSSGTWIPSGGGSTILNTNINDLLDGGTNVTVTTGTSGAEIGDIMVDAPITKSAGASDVTLTLRAANSVRVNEAITSTSGRMNVVLDADNNNGTADGAGVVIVFADIFTNGGNLSFGTGRTLSIGGVPTLVGGDLFVGGTGARTFSTNGGDINVHGELLLANPDGLTLTSGGGNIQFYGLLNSGNAYTFVDGPDFEGSWDWARDDAKNGTAGGSAVGDSYLVTITSRLENAIAAAAGNYTGAWIGAYRPDITQRIWTWADGPEGGVHFFTQNDTNNGGTAVDGYYANFGSGEPNGCQVSPSSCDETVGQFFGTRGEWNDLRAETTFAPSPFNEYQVVGYIRETNLPNSPLTVNAGTGNVTFSDAIGNAKALASLNVTGSSVTIADGARTEGTIKVDALTGDLSIAGAISSDDISTSTIILNAGTNNSAGDASGGNILVAPGTTITTGAGGRATLYTGSITGSTGLTDLVGSGSGMFRYNSDEVATNYLAPLGVGAYAVYREQPLVTVTAGSGAMTYGQTAPSLAANATGMQNGDSATMSAEVENDAPRSSSGHLTAGTHTVVSNGASDLGYAVNLVNGTLTVTPAAVSTTGLAANSRTYDGTTLATLDAEGAIYNGMIAGDVLTVSGDAAFDDKHAGAAKSVSISGLSLGGIDAGNYTLTSSTASTTADIYKAALTISSTDVVKTYDGTVAANGTAIIIAGQLFDGDVMSGGSFQFTDKNAGTNKTVEVGDVALNDGNGGENYEVTYADNVSSTINRATISAVTGITVPSKLFDGTTAVTLDVGNALFNGMIAGDALTVASANGALSDPNPGAGKTVHITDLSLGGADSGNYILANTTATATTDIINVGRPEPLPPPSQPQADLPLTSAGGANGTGGANGESGGSGAVALLVDAGIGGRAVGRGEQPLSDDGAVTAMDGVRYGDSSGALILYILSADGVLTVEVPESVPAESLGDEAQLRRLASEKLGVDAARIRTIRVNSVGA